MPVGYDFFKGVLPADSSGATPEDVARRQAIAKRLQDTQLQAQNPLGVLANFLSGSTAGYESSAAADESATGRSDATAALAKALSGDIDPSELAKASGSGFLTDTQSDLIGNLFKRKLGIGETFFGTPIVATDADGKVHYYQAGSMGDTREMNPGDGMAWAPKQQFLNTGTEFVAAPQNAGVDISAGSPGVPATVPINNTQTEIDKTIGSGIATDVLKQKADAEGAAKLMQYATQGESLLDQGALTGAGAGAKVNILKWAASLGVPVPQDAANNSDAFQAVMGQAVGQIIKQFGSGTGLSDADRQYAKAIAGGDIELNEAAIRKIIGMAKQSAQATIDSYNAQAKAVQSGNVGDMLTVKTGAGAPTTGSYTVKAGDSLRTIAAANGTTPEAILAANPSLGTGAALPVGTALVIPGAGTGAPAGFKILSVSP